MSARILIAEDDLEIAELFRFTFETDGYTVIPAYDGEDAWQKISTERPDLVILDVMMPKLTGFEVCEKIRNTPSFYTLPVIMLTSLAQTKDRITGIKLGADDYLTKPVETYELLARVERLLERTQSVLSANPVTGLPGTFIIKKEIEKRTSEGQPFGLIYLDLDNFKIYNDKYGTDQGDNVIRLTGTILTKIIDEYAKQTGFIGHFGGDDFLLLVPHEQVRFICETIIHNFKNNIYTQYDDETQRRGSLWATDKFGQEHKYPLLTISLGATVVKETKKYAQIIDQAKQSWRQAKMQNDNSYRIS